MFPWGCIPELFEPKRFTQVLEIFQSLSYLCFLLFVVVSSIVKKKSVHLVSLWLLDASVRLTVLTFYKTQNVGHCLSMCGQNCCAVLNEAHHLFSVAADSPPPPPSVQLPPDATISKVSGGFSLPFLRLPRLVHSTSVYTWLHMTMSPCTLPNANLCRFFLFSVTVEISAKPFIR